MITVEEALTTTAPTVLTAAPPVRRPGIKVAAAMLLFLAIKKLVRLRIGRRVCWRISLGLWRRIMIRLWPQSRPSSTSAFSTPALVLPPDVRAMITSIADARLELFDELCTEANRVREATDYTALLERHEGRTKPFKLDLIDPTPDPASIFSQFALQPRIVELVQGYLGIQPRLYATYLWLDIPTPSEPTQSQLWHRDGEDFMNVKMFVHLSDVTQQTGPFCVIPWRLSLRLYPRIARTSDEVMARVVPRTEWVQATGPQGTVTFADTCACFHRGLKPTPQTGPRFLYCAVFTAPVPMWEWRRLGERSQRAS